MVVARPIWTSFQPALRQVGACSLSRPSMMILDLTRLAEPIRVELAELRPLGQVQHHLGAEQRLLDAGHLGEALARWQSGLRVIDPYVGTAGVQLIGHGQRGGVAGVVGAGLERRPEHRDPLAGHIPACLVDCQLGELGPLAGVDRLDGADEVAEHVDAELVGTDGQRGDVLRAGSRRRIRGRRSGTPDRSACR